MMVTVPYQEVSCWDRPAALMIDEQAIGKGSPFDDDDLDDDRDSSDSRKRYHIGYDSNQHSMLVTSTACRSQSPQSSHSGM